MARLRQALAEIHRRAVWQVLTFYLAGAWVAFNVSRAIAEGRGLPGEFRVFFLILLAVGLPVVLITTYVQRGFPVRAGDGSNGAEDLAAPVEGRFLERTFTWKNAILGGITAFTLWAIVATGWFVLAEKLVGQSHERTQVESTPARER